jgi:NADP-dependent 3-hydroxy acid dehydrogenase YdfG
MTYTMTLNPQGEDLQTQFAEIVRDFNPVHIDPIAARSSMFGQRIVHGIHGTIRQLDALIDQGKLDWITPETALSLKVDYRQPTYPSDTVKLEITEKGPGHCRIDVLVDDLKVGLMTLKVDDSGGFKAPERKFAAKHKTLDLEAMTAPVDHSLDDLAALETYTVSSNSSRQSTLAVLYPAAAAAFGPNRLYGIGILSSVVGMVTPGLYSLFVGFKAHLKSEQSELQTLLDFDCEMNRVHPEFRFVNFKATSPTIQAVLETVSRPRPEKQPLLSEIISKLETKNLDLPDLTGAKALVIGGSRGIGATTVKLLSHAGADVTFTYTSSEKAAAVLTKELSSANVRAVKDNVLKPEMRSKSFAVQNFDQIYYFATPQIFVRKTKNFDTDLYTRFCDFYLAAFHDICRNFSKAGGSVFYPSSVAVLSNDLNTMEYRLSKLAGEGMCETLSEAMQDVTFVMERLPRLASDQTATIQGGHNADTIEVFSAIIQKMS